MRARGRGWRRVARTRVRCCALTCVTPPPRRRFNAAPPARLNFVRKSLADKVSMRGLAAEMLGVVDATLMFSVNSFGAPKPAAGGGTLWAT